MTEDAGKLGVPKITNSGVVLPSESSGNINSSDWGQLVSQCKINLGDAKSLSKNKLEKELKSACKFGTTKIRNFINKAIELGVLIERPGNTWGFCNERAEEIKAKTEMNEDPTLPF